MTGSELIASTRMYDVTPAVAALWRNLIDWVSLASGVPLEMIDYPAPAPLHDLWTRPDMGCVFVCGWPLYMTTPAPVPLAAPVPISDDCPDAAAYRTHFVVRADGDFCFLEETFGTSIAWTETHSHSGFNAPRYHLLRYRGAKGERLFSRSIGPLVTPRRAIEYVLSRGVVVAPIDGYFLALLKYHEPETARHLRSVATTWCSPVPPLVAAAGTPPDIVSSLREALCRAGDFEEMRAVMHALRIRKFVGLHDLGRYSLTAEWDRQARREGYAQPE